MLDKEGRILIDMLLSNEKGNNGKVYFYYSVDQKLFYFLFKRASAGYYIGEATICDNKIKIPDVIKNAYDTEKIFWAEKDDRMYLIPLKKD